MGFRTVAAGFHRRGNVRERLPGKYPAGVAQQPAAAEITWREIGTWSGRLSQQTESFEVSPVARNSPHKRPGPRFGSKARRGHRAMSSAAPTIARWA